MRNLLAATAISTVMALGGAVFAQETAPMTADSILATVGETEITLGHVIALHGQLPENIRSNMAPDDLFDAIINQLIDQTLLAQAVDAADIPKHVQNAIENETRAQIAGVKIDGLLDLEITEEKIEELYRVTVENMVAVPEFNASHILVETEDEAKELVVMLADGADFAELAQEKSTGPSGPTGGALGFFSAGMMVPEFEQAVIALDVGAVSDPVQTQFGWHVIKLNETRDLPAPGLEELRPQLLNQLVSQVISVEIEAQRLAVAVTQVEGVDSSVLTDPTFVTE